MLQINNLSVRYSTSAEWAIKDISFNAIKGQITLITGASGSGKSTLARTIMTLIPKFYSAEIEGEILVKHKNILSYPRSDLIKLCGYVPQYPADFTTTLSVEEEVALILENLGIASEDISRKIDQVFTSLEISHLRNRVQTELSSGELQRVAIATSLVPDVPILILDEPMARIDLKSELMLVKLLEDLAQEGKIILAFEHRLDYLLGASNKVILLDKGQISSQGTPKEVIYDLITVDAPEISLLYINDSLKLPISLSEAQQMLKQI